MIICGKNTVFEAIRSKRKITKIIILESNKELYKKVNDLIKVEIQLMSLNQMNKICSDNHQGIIAYTDEYKYVELPELIKKNKEKDAVLVVLANLEDPHNLGAILRTADAAMIDGIIIPKNRSVSLNSTVAKVSTGAIEHIDVSQVANLVTSLEALKKAGYWIIGLEMEGSIDYRKQDYSGKIVVVIGSEGKGIPRLVKEACDFMVNIPMYGHVTSLNASVSASLLFYEILRSRGK